MVKYYEGGLSKEIAKDLISDVDAGFGTEFAYLEKDIKRF